MHKSHNISSSSLPSFGDSEKKFFSPSLGREILLALLGHHGNVIVKKFESSPNKHLLGFELHPDFPIHEGDREIINRVCNLGSTYSALTRFASSSFNSLFTSCQGQEEEKGEEGDFHELLEECDGFYFRGFCRGLDDLLEGYRGSILDLEQLWIQQPFLPLSYVFQPLQDWELILPHLFSLVLSIEESHLRGNELLDLVHDHCLACSIPIVSQSFITLQNRCRNILYNQILEWMTQGTLNDPFSEFFIQQLGGKGSGSGSGSRGDQRRRKQECNDYDNEEEEDEEEGEEGGGQEGEEDFQLISKENRLGVTLWDSFDIRSTMLPSFIPPSVAEKVLFVGKAVLLLNQASKRSSTSRLIPSSSSSASSRDSSSSFRHTALDLSDIVRFGKSLESLKLQSTPFHLPSFEQAIDSLRQRVSSRLWNFIVLDSKLVSQLRALKNYFLLGKGDLWQTWIEQSKTLLSLPPSPNASAGL
jgi:gamma-tubulin complex component 4